jgi:GAF domain-containing protein
LGIIAVIHLLIIAEDNVAFPPIAAPSPAGEFKSLHKPNLTAARPLLEAGMFDVCLLGVAKLSEDTHWIIAEFRTIAPHCPLIVAPRQGSPEDERAAYLAGADLVLAPSCDQATILAVVRRLAARASRTALANGPRASASPFLPAGTIPAAFATSALAVMRDFSQVFSYSLDFKQFTVGIPAAHDPQRLVCAGAVGLPADLIECFELSRKSGLGQRIAQTGRILHLGSESTAPFLAEDPRIQREFEILGCEIALPVNDRERTIGVALLGGRLTGTPFSDSELLLVYHLMEELGLAVKNSWLHHQLSASHRLFSDVLGAMTSGALVIGPDLAVLFANQALLRALKGDAGAGARLEFADLPPPLARSLHEVVERGQSLAPFLYEHPGAAPAGGLHPGARGSAGRDRGLEPQAHRPHRAALRPRDPQFACAAHHPPAVFRHRLCQSRVPRFAEAGAQP